MILSVRVLVVCLPLAMVSCGTAPIEVPLHNQPLPACLDPELRALEQRRDAHFADWEPWATRAQPGERAAAWRALARMGRTCSLDGHDEDLWSIAAAEKDPRVVIEIAFALPRTNCKYAEAWLAHALHHEDGRVRAGAARGLAYLAETPYWDRLLRQLSDEHPLARADAATALLAWIGERATNRPEVPYRLRERIAQELLRLSGPAEEVPFVRWRALHALAEMSEPWPDADIVIGAYLFLQDEIDLVRFEAARLMARLTEHPAALKALHLLARDADPRVAEVAAEALHGKLEGKNFRSLRRSLASALDALPGRATGQPRRQALARLLVDDPFARHVLRRAMEEDPSPNVRAAAFRGLHRIDSASLSAEREAFLSSPSWVLREAAVLALADCEDSSYVLNVLARSHQDAAAPVRNAAATVLFEQREHWPAQLGELLRERLRTGDLGVVGTLAELWIAAQKEQLAPPLSEFEEEWRAARARFAPIDSLELSPLIAKVLDLEEPDLSAVPFDEFDLSIFAVEPRRRVTLTTTKGDLLIELDGKETPRHAANFLSLVESGALKGLCIHRRVPGFVIQGGDPRGDGWGSGGVRLPNEISPLVYGAGSVGMPDAGLDTGGTQFFFAINSWPHLEGRYTRFARLLRGGPRVLMEIERGDLILDARVEAWPKPPARGALGAMVRDLKRPIFIAHRGASNGAPENTLAAYRLAWEQGAAGAETDVWLTADQQIVCLHDESLKRTTGVDRSVHALSYEELSRLDAGGWKDPSHRGERIPLLEEVLAEIPKGKCFFLEVKDGPAIVPHLKKLLDRSDRRDQVTVISFSFETLRQLRVALPDVPMLWLVGTKDHQPIDPAKVKLAVDAGFQGLNVSSRGVHPALIDAARAAKTELFVWTVNDRAEADRLIALGVAGITSDTLR